MRTKNFVSVHKYLLVLVACITFSLSCCKTANSTSSQITREEQKCSVDKVRSGIYMAKYGSHYSGRYKQESFDLWSNVPEEYLQWVFDKHNVSVSDSGSAYGWGVTQLSFSGANFEQRIPVYIQGAYLTFRHEFGHASFGAIQEMHETFFSELKVISDLIIQKYQSKSSQYLNSYGGQAQNRLDEVLAELFDTWYCSQQAREHLKEGMPEVYDFAVKYLLPPLDGKDVSSNSVKLFVKNEGSTNTIFLVDNQGTSGLSYCIGTKDYCSNASNSLSLNKINISSKVSGYRIDNLNLTHITGDNALYIYGKTGSNTALLRTVQFSKK